MDCYGSDCYIFDVLSNFRKNTTKNTTKPGNSPGLLHFFEIFVTVLESLRYKITNHLSFILLKK